MDEKYYRLICFVVDICCEPPRKLFIKCAHADTLHRFSNLCGYLSQRKSQICKLRLRHDQYQLLFPANGVPDENKWDVTLLVTLITNLFQVQPLISCSLVEIITIRNELQHICCSTRDMPNDDFEDYWMRLETATLTLARDVSSGTYEDDIRKKIDQTRNSNMPNLADCLRTFCEEHLKEMRQKLCVKEEEIKRLTTKTEEKKKKMISVAANTIETTSKLRQVCVTKLGPTDCNHSVPSNNALRLQVVRSVQSVGQYRVRIDSDSDKWSCCIQGCCMLPGGEILLADDNNGRLKKLDSAYNVISVCHLPCLQCACYIGNNVAVVSMSNNQLVYVDVSSMTVRNTVTTDHRCFSITCHNDKLYVMSDDTVYMYTLDGNNRSTLYKLQNNSFYITGIAVSADGNRIYIADGDDRMITIDNFGNLLNSLTFPDARAVCVDDRGNVWVGSLLNKLNQVSADGARLLGRVSVDELNGTWAICYDRDRSSLIVAGGLNDNIRVVRLD